MLGRRLPAHAERPAERRSDELVAGLVRMNIPDCGAREGQIAHCLNIHRKVRARVPRWPEIIGVKREGDRRNPESVREVIRRRVARLSFLGNLSRSHCRCALRMS